MTSRWLIIGASGFIGSHLFARIGPSMALGTCYATPVAGTRPFTPGVMKVADLIRDQGRFSHAFVLHGMTRLDPCAADRARSDEVNVLGTQRLLEELFEQGIKPVFTSSDMVFDGRKGNYLETDPVGPLATYGEQKVRIETFLRESGREHLVLRLPKVYSKTPGTQTLFDEWLGAIDRGDLIRLAQDQRFCPVAVEDLVVALEAAARLDLSGTYHCGGPETLTRLQMFQHLRNALERRFGPLEGLRMAVCGINDFPFLEPRPIDISMDSGRFRQATGLTMGRVETMAHHFVQSLQRP
ncbi:MAG: sugar nucleotide-binding protein [Magnetococcales bacterium]|nr:sugar nucleotide-binding protein [Magnetococcales bacterium]